jgi:hypothetical protein
MTMMTEIGEDNGNRDAVALNAAKVDEGPSHVQDGS